MNSCRTLKRHRRYGRLYISKHANCLPSPPPSLSCTHMHTMTFKPFSIRLPCRRHQKQALSFMLGRERGWALHNPQKDLWSVEICPSGSRIYINNITQDTRDEPLPEFRGGILADHMGLGKSLSMISLIASDCLEESNDNQTLTLTSSACWAEEHQGIYNFPSPSLARMPEQYNEVPGQSQLTKATLLIVPSSLLSSWESQLIKHLYPGVFRWVKHHGSHRLRDLAELRKYNLVISTFQTVSSEYRRQDIAPNILFSTSWHRIVLDEAHRIRNRNATITKAVCAIQATSRWAMTGTPIQNRLTDFASLLQFLRIFPYSDYKVFESHITNVWKTQGDKSAIERLKKLVKYITLRRSQSVIELPERTDSIQYLDFSPAELVRYRQAELPVAEMLDSALSGEDSQYGMYMHALAQINTLRQFCNLGLSAPTLKTDIGNKLCNPGAIAWNYTTAQEAFRNLASLGQASCVLCYVDLDITFQDGLSLADNFPRAQLTQCLRLICDTCFQQSTEDLTTPPCVCKDRESCSVVPVSMNRVTGSPVTPKEYVKDCEELPTKIKSLFVELLGARSEKW
jgi:SWI/SNF-related matrix-associated actin-dependent regulator of chromatin subfamily A3